MSTITAFDPAGELPSGRMAIEASAGTGKTFALATLAARYVAEQDVPVGELLIVTFTRAAAAELKDRIRARLVEFAAALRSDAVPHDRVLAELVSVEREQRLRRVLTALADFDGSTISTIHGFAQQVLGSLGSSVPVDPDGVLADDTMALVNQVATDVLAREAILCRHPQDGLPSHSALVAAAVLAFGNPAAVLVPSDDPGASTPEAALTRSFVDEVMDEVSRRRRAAGVLSFDDLLVRLRDALEDPDGGPSARHALRRRYQIALIDEFQDTDPVQWSIFDDLFGGASDRNGDAALTVVGDPKQAIYGFRSADVHTYLEAVHAGGTDLVGLTTNWRSDGAVLRALELLLTGATFGDDLIGFQPVTAAESHRDRRMVTADGAALPALAIRLAQGPEVQRQKRKPQFVKAEAARSAIHADLAQHVRRLLESARIPDDRHPGDTRDLRPDDIAVLIAANAEGPPVREALRAAGIPAVITRGDNVLESEAATQWHRLLSALARPADVRRARAYALSWFVGWDAERLAVADDVELGELQEALHRWGELLERQGVAAFVGTLRAETGVAVRVLSRADGDRAMTDLDHVAELLHLVSPRRTSPVMLLSTFEAIGGGDEDGDPEADLCARRVESEADAVQIMTTYVAKGLEFPVVCCPTLWSVTPVDPHKVDPVYWDPEQHLRTVDVAFDVAWPDEGASEERLNRAVDEAIGSNLRVLYVALTRARHHTAVWWAPVEGAEATGLARVLFARHSDGSIDHEAFTAGSVSVPQGGSAVAALTLLAGTDDHFEIEEVDAPAARTVPWIRQPAEAPSMLRVADLGHTPDRGSERWSFTLLTSRAFGGHDELLDPLDESVGDAGSSDELTSQVSTAADAELSTPDTEAERVVPHDVELPLGRIAGGAGFGTLVHEVLERVDFTSSDLEGDLATSVRDRLAWNPWPVDPEELVRGLASAIRTPLGPQFAGRPLAELARGDRLDELVFDLTLGERGNRASDAEIGRLLLHHLPEGAPLRPWAERIARGPFSAVLAGHLTGSIDLVARVRDADGAERFVVADYKTNRVAPKGSQPRMAMFHPDRLVDEMARADYPLQALLYSVALHRYLRWRLRDYDPSRHLGGIAYMFVRGMVGPDTPTVDATPHGLFAWHPPVDLIGDLSDLLDGADRSLEVGS